MRDTDRTALIGRRSDRKKKRIPSAGSRPGDSWHERRIGCCSVSTLLAFVLAINLALLCIYFLSDHMPADGSDPAGMHAAGGRPRGRSGLASGFYAHHRSGDTGSQAEQEDYVANEAFGLTGKAPKNVPAATGDTAKAAGANHEKRRASIGAATDDASLIEEVLLKQMRKKQQQEQQGQQEQEKQERERQRPAEAVVAKPQPKDAGKAAAHLRKVSHHANDNVFFPIPDAQMEEIGAYCPCCGFAGAEFAAFRVRKKAQCPKCLALERHRLSCATFDNFILHPFQEEALARSLDVAASKNKISNVADEYQKPTVLQRLRLLHFGPMASMATAINNADNLVEHFQADFDPNYAYKGDILKVDVQNIRFPDDTFDAVIILHVLEHVPNDTLAFEELSRVLKPDGKLVFEVPCVSSATETVSCLDLKSNEERAERCGQYDHLRKYACSDVESRLLAPSPFACELPKELFTRKALDVLVPTHLARQYLCANGKR